MVKFHSSWEVTKIFLAAVVQASVREEKKLMVENAKLRNDIEELKKQLLEKEKRRGGMFILVPSRRFHCRSNACLSLKKTLIFFFLTCYRNRLRVPALGTFDVSCCSLQHCFVWAISDSALGIWLPPIVMRFFFFFWFNIT